MNIKLNAGGVLLATVGIVGGIVLCGLSKSSGKAVIGIAGILGLFGGVIGNAIWGALFPPKPRAPLPSEHKYAAPFVPEAPEAEPEAPSAEALVAENGLNSIAAFLGSKGFLTPPERAFLEGVRKEWGLPDDAVAKAQGWIRAKKAEVWIPPNPADREKLVQKLVQAAAVSGKIDDVKKATLRDIAAAAEIPAARLDPWLTSPGTESPRGT
jgi:hypothetical protein